MKNYLLSLTFLFATTIIITPFSIRAQDCTLYFPIEQGGYAQYEQFNKKGKLQGTTELHLTNTTELNGIKNWNIQAKGHDQKSKELYSMDYNMSCENGIFKIDMKSMAAAIQGMKMDQMGTASISGDFIQFPKDMVVGNTLENGNLTVDLGNGGMPLKMEVQITDRKVISQEEITTKAGTFNCYKITSTNKTKMMFSFELKNIEWVSPGIGLIKSETYKGSKKIGSTELSSLAK